MRPFVLTLILAVVAMAAIRVWLVDMDEEEERAEAGNVASFERGPIEPPDAILQSSVSASDHTGAEISARANQDDEIPVFYASGDPDLPELLAFLGLDSDQFIENAAAWYRKRGIDLRHFGFSMGATPIQPYEQYDEQTLLTFAESGDMWAQQILGDRWLMTRPAASMEMLKQAAEQGSAAAMANLGLIYSASFVLREPYYWRTEQMRLQAESILAATPDPDLESARWTGAAQIMSGGLFEGPDDGQFTGDFAASRNLDPERQRDMCVAALEHYEALRDAHTAAGQAPFEMAASPLFGASGKQDGQCDLPGWPRPDTSHCLQVRIVDTERGEEDLVSFCPSQN